MRQLYKIGIKIILKSKRIKRFVQRGRKGYSKHDLYIFNTHIVMMILNAIRDFRKEGYEIDPEGKLEDGWVAIQNCILNQMDEFTTEEREALYKRVDKGFETFKDVFFKLELPRQI